MCVPTLNQIGLCCMKHDYINIDLQVVWEVVRQDLPLLKDQITGLV